MLGQVAIEDKSHEMTAIPQLLDLRDLRGCTVTIDAMGCQTAIAAKIVEAQGHYVLALKANHPTLHQDVQDTFRYAAEDAYQGVAHDHAEQVEKAHGRITEREYRADLDPKQHWRGLAAIGLVEVERQTGTETTTERRYYLTSHTDAARFAEAVRSHWGIENRLHWVLDVIFHEDASRIRSGNAPQNMAVVRHMARNLLRQEPSNGSIKMKRFRAALDDGYLARVLGW